MHTIKVELEITDEQYAHYLKDDYQIRFLKKTTRDCLIPIKDVFDTVCKHYGVTKRQVRGKSHKRKIVDARMWISHFLTEYSKLTVVQAGDELNRHHATICHYKTRLQKEIIYVDQQTAMDDLKATFNV